MGRKIFSINITQKLFIYLLIASIVPLLVFGIIAINTSNSILKNEITGYTNDLLVDKQSKTNLMMDSVEGLIANLSSIDEIKDILGKVNNSNDNYSKLTTQAQIGYILSGYYNLKGLVSIDIFSVDGRHYHVGDTLNFQDIRNDLKDRLYTESLTSGKNVYWNGIDDNVNINSKYSKVITATKIIKVLDSKTMLEKPVGMILINSNPEVFNNEIFGGSYNEASYIMVDSKNRIIYHPDMNMIGQKIDSSYMKQINGVKGNFVDKINGIQMILTYSKSNESGWYTIGLLPVKFISDKTSIIGKNMMMLLIPCFLFIILSALLVSKKYIEPIKKITELFKQIKKGNIDIQTRLKASSNDEIGQLVMWFNTFLISLKDKKIAEEKLLKSREQYRSVVDNIKEVIFQADIQGNWTFLNPAWEYITGYTVDESIGNCFLKYVHPDDKQYKYELFMQFIEGKIDSYTHTARYIKKDGTVIWANTLSRLTFDKENKVLGISGTIMDITELKIMEQELVSRDNLLRGISDATNILLETNDYDKAFYKALSLLGNLTVVDRVCIFKNHTHPETGQTVVSELYEWCRAGIKPKIDHLKLKSTSYDGFMLMRWFNKLSAGETISGLIKDLPQDERDILEFHNIVSVLIVPIFSDKKLWGFINFDDCTQERVWSKVEEVTLHAAAASISGAFKRMKAEEALQKALHNDFRNTVQNLQNLVFRLRKSDDGKVFLTLFEGRIAKESHLDTEIVYGKSLQEILGSQTAEYCNLYIEKAFEGNDTAFEIKLKDRFFYAVLSPIIQENHVIEIVGSVIDITKNKAAEDKIKYMAYYDELTGLPNRLLFNERLKNVVSNINSDGSLAAIMYLDIDQFKLINDTLGHIIGDLMLIEVAERLKSCLRDENIVTRMGGDEFIILYSHIVSEDEITLKAQELLDVFKRPFSIKDNEFFVTASIGISLCPNDGEDMETLVKNADMAMYKVKDHGRNNYQFYNADMKEESLQRLVMKNSLQKAVENNEFVLYYQPLVDVQTGKVIGSEALIRWEHPILGMLQPNEFIPLAEETGVVVTIGEWVLRTACMQNKIWQDSENDSLRISVNISALQFQQNNFVEKVGQILKETDLDPSYLDLEITESSLLRNTERTIETIHDLKSIGIKISIDDFGTGFSSLAYLKRFDVDTLKIDKTFINDINTDNEAIITAIINMAHCLNIKVTAEGVEEEEQLSFLKSENCNIAQGYLFSKPVSAYEFGTILKEWSLLRYKIKKNLLYHR